ncbi:MAG TPA: glycosyltransferase family 2 protein [Pyrinomonadaceae bacterium]|jgi:glycosyltransferase involved in cell wall biosynthesis
MPETFTLLSVIIPVYNEKTTISEVIEKVSAVALPIEKEIIVVDDGSTDGTVEILRSNSVKVANTYLTPINIGKGAAVRIGLTLAKGEIILIQDADLELDPNEYERLLAPILTGETSVVYGSRFLGENPVAPLRRFANYFLTSVTNVLFRTNLTDMETAYKVFTSEVAGNLSLAANRFEIEPEITAQIARRGFHIREVPISYRPRTKFEGKKISWKDGFKALWTLLKYRFSKN